MSPDAAAAPQSDLIQQLAAAIAADVKAGGGDEGFELREIIGKLAEDLGPALAAIVPGAECALGRVQVTRVSEYLATPREMSMFVMARLGKHGGFVILRLGAEALEWWVSSSLGGAPGRGLPPGRGISSVEARLGRVVVDMALVSLARVLSAFGIDTSFHECRVATEADDVPKVRDDPWVHCVTLGLCRDPAGLGLDVVVPESLAADWAEHMRSKALAGNSVAQGKSGDKRWSDTLEAQLASTRVRVEAILSQSMIDLGSIAQWALGETISLEVTARTPVRLVSESVPLFECEFGKRGGNLTLRLDAPIDAESDLLNEVTEF